MQVVHVVAVVGDGVADGRAGAVYITDDVVIVALPPAQIDPLGPLLPFGLLLHLRLPFRQSVILRGEGGGEPQRAVGHGLQHGGESGGRGG